jgi:hypothetical protein
VGGLALPYDLEIFFSAMARWHAAWFPAPLVGVALAVAALVLTWRPLAGRRTRDRLIGLILASFALWVGAVHQLRLMATFDFMAPLYGGVWLVQAAATVALVVARPRLHFRATGAGLGLAALALVGYPLAVVAMGYGWPAAPLVGTAPDPTAVFTAALVATARGRARFALLVVPLAWAGVAALSAVLLGFALDGVVAAAILAAIALAFARR